MISREHPSYIEMSSIWKKNRDAFSGAKKIKEAGTLYLPKLGYHLLGTEGEAEYNVYREHAIWLDATYRTVTAMAGLVFRKPVYVDGKDIDKYKNDFTLYNESLSTAAQQVVIEALLQGRVGVYVSYPDIDTTKLSKAEFEKMDLHSYSTIYKTEDIINWKLERRNGKIVPTLVVLRENVADPSTTDMFDTSSIVQYRVLELDENNEFKETVYAEKLSNQANYSYDQTNKGFLVYSIYPTKNGERFNHIPFYPITPRGVSWEIVKSPMEGIVDLNIGHYRNSATYEMALVKTASPTAVLRGYQGREGDKLILGGNNAILLDVEGGAEFLEYTGSGLSSIQKALEDKKRDMAILGVRILAAEEASNISAETSSIHQAGEQAVLANIANSASEALTRAAQDMAIWDDYDDKLSYDNIKAIKVKLNNDFTPNALTANDINALTVLWKSLGISDEEFFTILKEGEIIPADKTFELHKKELEESMLYDAVMAQTESQSQTSGFMSPVDAKRLTKPENPGEPNADKSADSIPHGDEV